MKFGLSIFATDEGPNLAELAQLVEAAGFESLFLPEHTHIPALRASPPPGRAELPREYSRTLDPFVALTAAAVATTRLRLGTGICLITQRDPIVTAKAVATLDQLSDGRFLFGVGAGWNLEELANHGTDPSRRFGLLKDRVRAMQTIWTEEEASYRGRWVEFDRIWSWPKPAQQPHPPVLIAGNGPMAEARVLRYGDEWLPVSRPGLDSRIASFLERSRDLERGPLAVTVYGAETRFVERYEEAGAHRCVFWLPPRGEAEIFARVAELATHLGLNR